MIFTSLTALYDLKFIRYKPEPVYIELPFPCTTSNYSKKYKISTQNKSTINIGVIELNEKKYYCGERLFIELEKYPLENTIKSEALKNLQRNINPQKVLYIYQKIKNKRRGLNHERIKQYLSKNLLDMDEILNQKNIDQVRVLREYIIAILSKNELPTSLKKGGSAIELLVDFKRATEDIDTHIDKKSINTIINTLANKENLIYFKVLNTQEIEEKIKDKVIIKVRLKAISRKNKINELLKDLNEIIITFNSTYTDQEINDMIKEYNITKSNLKLIKNGYGLIFSQEMLLAEKFNALIVGNEDTKRTKDLIDLANLYDNNIDLIKFKKWLFKKWSKKLKNPLNENQAIDFIKTHKDIELTKIKENFNDAVKMYNTNLKYEDAIKIYHNLANIIINNNNK